MMCGPLNDVPNILVLYKKVLKKIMINTKIIKIGNQYYYYIITNIILLWPIIHVP